MTSLQPKSAERALQKTAQLRALTLALREAKERPAREHLLAQFESFRQAVESSQGNQGSLPSPDALLVGIKAHWARGDYATIQLIASILPDKLLGQQPLLRIYVKAVADRQQP
jgi:hypothetical protein